MNQEELRSLLARVASGEATVDEAERALKVAPFTDLGYAKVDNQRGIRQGVSEVVYGAGKTAEQIAGICRALVAGGQRRVLVTRLDAEKAREVEGMLSAQGGDGGADLPFEYRAVPRIGIAGAAPEPAGEGYVAVVAAGTSDLPIAEEAAVTLEALGTRTMRLYDVGVAGIHRLLAHAGDIAGARCVVAVAGMEGALPSVVGGLASCPVIAVPTSVGYGASLGGIAALLAMLNSCASGISVVNIDNGFGAGYQAHMIAIAAASSADRSRVLEWHLEENATRGQLLAETMLQLPSAKRVAVRAAAAAAGVPHRHHHDIGEVLATIDGLDVNPRVKADMRGIYSILAQAEATAHGCAVDETHFHEVGEGSRIEATLLQCLAIEAIDPQEIVCSRVQVGEGTVVCAHGELDVPAPATAAIIARGIPENERHLPGERLTPTSAAIILHYVTRFEA